MRCPACRKILEGNSPDLLYLNRGDRATFGVDAVRGLKADVLIPPNELATKIYVLEEAHLLTPQAQNALLLTLEEPPSYVLFLLLANSAEPLLETVRSRAPVLRMEHLSPAEIREHLCKTNPEASLLARNDPHAMAELLAAADGSIGRAELLLDPKRRHTVQVRRENVRTLLRLTSTRHTALDALSFMQSLPQKREELIPQCSETLVALRDLLLAKQSESAPLCFFAEREEAEDLAYRFTTPELLRLADALEESISALRANANVRLTVTALAVSFGILQ
jgi:DNA polymerase-3 subunit delta'